MTTKNTPDRYGKIARGFHAIMTLLILILIPLGMYMADLEYYDSDYNITRNWHRTLGMLVFAIAWLRLAWRLIDPPPPFPINMPLWEQILAKATHWSIYALFFITPIFGYLLSTADGHALNLFGIIEIPAILPGSKAQEEWAGEIHEILGFTMAAILILHIAAALKHHFIDKDNTLLKMFGR